MIDAYDAHLIDQLKQLKPAVVIHTVGPFQGQHYHVASSCLAAGINYIDLADDIDFVMGIEQLNAQAIEKGVAVIPNIRSRLMGMCSIPDIVLFKEKYGIPNIVFYPSIESKLLHLLFWCLSWLVRLGWIKQLDAYAEKVSNFEPLFGFFGYKG